MHVEQQLRRSTHGVQADRTGAVIGERAVEAAQVRAQIFEDAAGIDRARRIARVERNESAQVRQSLVEEFAHASIPSFRRKPESILVLMCLENGSRLSPG